jgi:hypothetical protein
LPKHTHLRMRHLSCSGVVLLKRRALPYLPQLWSLGKSTMQTNTQLTTSQRCYLSVIDRVDSASGGTSTAFCGSAVNAEPHTFLQ